MVKPSKFVSDESLLPFVQDAGGSTALIEALKDGTDAFADLWNRDRRCVFFFPGGLPTLRTKSQSAKELDGDANPASCELHSPTTSDESLPVP